MSQASAPRSYSLRPRPHFPLPRPLLLVGMMGCGKSTIAPFLAGCYRVEVVDIDQEIQKQFDSSIPDIFEHHGEEAFREAEAAHLTRAMTGPVCVVSAGGGAFLRESVRDVADKHAISLWLRVSVATIHARTIRSKHRPLLNTPNRKQVIENLTKEREPIYAQAHVTVDCEGGRGIVRDRILLGLDKWIEKNCPQKT